MLFSKQTKFRKNAILKKLNFAFMPTFIDGGVRKIWLQFYWDLYEQKETSLSWDSPDVFWCIGGYSSVGAKNKLAVLQQKDSSYHWAHEDKDYLPNYLVPQKNKI